MNLIKHAAVFGIVVNEEHQFSVWPLHRKLPPGWCYTGPTGTRAAMHEAIRQQFVETVPATYLAREGRIRAAQRAE